jgi:hypothetical protein
MLQNSNISWSGNIAFMAATIVITKPWEKHAATKGIRGGQEEASTGSSRVV